MGSSTTSERTINTSTESANTILTNVTATDGETTEDSLDNEQSQDILISLDSASSIDGKPQRNHNRSSLVEKRVHNSSATKTNHTTNEIHYDKPLNILDSDIILPETPFVNERRKSECVRMRDAIKGPSTAPPGYHSSDTRFPFDSGVDMPDFTASQSAKEPKSVFDSIGNSPSHKNSTKFVFDIPIPISPTENQTPDLLMVAFDPNEKPPKSPKASSSKNETKFTFEGFPLPAVHKDKRHSTDSRTSQKSKSRKSSMNESKTNTSPLPDLRIDFFSDVNDSQTKNNNNRRISCLHSDNDIEILKRELEITSNPSSRRPSTIRNNNETTNGSININVTTNPLDNGSGCCNQSCPSYTNNQYRCCACCSNNINQNPNRKIPQATIVVQQASLSLDYSSVSTILIKDENDFVSNTAPSTISNHHKLSVKKKKQKDDNMKQLLDVTNQLTPEERHDFERRYGSPHHSRSQSVKTGTRGLLGPPPQRARVASMPSTGVEEQYYRLRHFSITGKGVVNRGDSLKSRRSRSNTSVASSNSSTEHLTPRASAPPSLASSRESSASAPPPAPYRVLVLGAAGVGKSSLISQFMTSEYLHAYDTSIDDDSGEKSVSVLLAGEESELVFLDQTCNIGPDADIDGPEPHAYCVVYSTSDRGSLRTAEGWLRSLENRRPNKARILVGNKADLVRSRTITTEEGKNLAINYDCKFIETSVGINHNVDELLVGLLTQIRLKQEHPERTRRRGIGNVVGGGGSIGGSSVQNTPRKQRGARLSASLKVRGLLGRVWARDSKSKSCENLHVL